MERYIVKKENLLKIAKNYKNEIKWTNKYDCPPGYEYNDKGYVVTKIPYPKVSINFLPYMTTKYSAVQLLYYNLVALTALNNDKPFEVLLGAIVNRAKQTYYSKNDVDEDVIQYAVEMYEDVEDIFIAMEELPTDILRMDNVWYSRDSEFHHSASVLAEYRMEHIDRVRDFMSIGTKYKTNNVSNASGMSTYLVREYWKKKGLTAKMRTLSSVSEAILYLKDNGEDSEDKEKIAEVAKVSLRTIYTAVKELEE